MTAIVGLVHEGRVWIGGDSAGSDGWVSTARSAPKVFANGPLIIGYTSSFRMGQILRHSLVVPDRGDADLEQWMCTAFVDAVRKALKDGGYASKKDETESAGCFLVGINGRLFEVQSDYQVAEQLEPWTATGSGEQLAVASLWTSAHVVGLRDQPEARVRLALQAAASYCTTVRGPFHIIVTEAP
jgi:ATP-dependent protease HslVU (ClpYQ) peptidase subunit